jgi:hypothetical protein
MTPAAAPGRLGGTVVAVALCLLLAGCAGNKRVNKDNFDKIQNGMTIADVQAILGEPSQTSGDASNVAAGVGVDVNMGAAPMPVVYTWESGKKSIVVTFTRGKVTAKLSAGL